MSLLTLYCGICDRYIEVYAVYSKTKTGCSECGEPLHLVDEALYGIKYGG